MSYQLAVINTESPGGPTRVGRKRATIFTSAAAALAAIALVLCGGAGAASATTILTISPAPPYSGVTTVTVSGTGTPGNFVAVTECNSTLGGLNGTFCNHRGTLGVPAFKTVLVNSSGNWSATISVRPTFSNWNYQTNVGSTPAGTTNCRAVGTQCQIQEIGRAHV